MTQPFQTGPYFSPSGMPGNPEFSGPHPMQGSDPCQSAHTVDSPGNPQASPAHQGPQMAQAPGMPDAGNTENCGCGYESSDHGGCGDQTTPPSGYTHTGAGPASPFPKPPRGPQPGIYAGRNPEPYPGPSAGFHPGMGQGTGPGMNSAPLPGQGAPASSGHPGGMPYSFQAMNGFPPVYGQYYDPSGMTPAQPMPHYVPDNSHYGFPGQAAGGPRPYGETPGGHAPGCSHADHGPGHPKHDAHQYGQFMGLVNDLANGKADPSRVMSFLGGLDGQFLKGALVGIGATLLLTSESVRKGMAGTLSNVFNALGKESREEKETTT